MNDDPYSSASIYVRRCERVRAALHDLVDIHTRDLSGDPDRTATDQWRENAWVNARLVLLDLEPLADLEQNGKEAGHA